MALTKKEKEQLEALQAKEKEPAATPAGRSVSFAVDLGDPEQVKTAAKLGLIDLSDDDDGEGEGDGDDDDDEQPPARRGFFPD